MCGRFVSSSTAEQIGEYFDAATAAESLGLNFNVAPTHDIYGVVADASSERRVDVFHWGLVPSWAKERKIGQRMINARSETLAEKPAFKGLFAKHRCIIPMNGFYEWKAGEKPKQPVFVHRADGEPLAVAGLWAAWRDPDVESDDAWLHSATIITTSANTTMEPVHDRMPVILPRNEWDRWLDPGVRDLDLLGRLLVPAPDDLLVLHEVSTEVNNVRNRGAHLVEPL
jgi:putative SOS response-associated peptidase YedK